MKTVLKHIFVISLISFCIHLLWEMLQMPLYTCNLNIPLCLTLCAKASLGDVVMTLGIYLSLIVATQNLSFPLNIRHGELVMSGFVGLLFAIIFELFALRTERWAYTNTMPLMPFLEVGLAPLLQMAIVTPLGFYLSHRILNSRKEN